MEHPLPWLFSCRLLGQQIKTHLFSEAHVLAQLLWRCSGVMLPPGKAQGCHTVLNGDSGDGAGQGAAPRCPDHGSRHPAAGRACASKAELGHIWLWGHQGH